MKMRSSTLWLHRRHHAISNWDLDEGYGGEKKDITNHLTLRGKEREKEFWKKRVRNRKRKRIWKILVQ